MQWNKNLSFLEEAFVVVMCNFASTRPILVHCWGDNLIHPILITAFVFFFYSMFHVDTKKFQ